tara:strand:+ start:418 stop:729 length:312 start_codon:yes stop_codon:yes gene_type:complete
MLIKDALNLETRNKLMEFSVWSNATNTDLQRKLVKGESYAGEVIKIRMMTKMDLSTYLRKVNSNKAVKVARTIKDPSMYRRFDSEVRSKIELYSYAYNRMLTL